MNKQTNKINQNLLCAIHHKEIEGFCQDCQKYLCSSCMFSSTHEHKNHNLLNMKELAIYLRSLINDQTNLLRHEYCEGFELSIREAKATLIQDSNRIMEQIDNDIKSIFEILKNRREQIFQIIKNNRDQELEKLTTQENMWKNRESIAKNILALQIDEDDNKLNSKMEMIVGGFKELASPPSIHEYNNIVDYDLNVSDKGGKNKIKLEELQKMIGEIFNIRPNDIVKLEYKA